MDGGAPVSPVPTPPIIDGAAQQQELENSGGSGGAVAAILRPQGMVAESPDWGAVSAEKSPNPFSLGGGGAAHTVPACLLSTSPHESALAAIYEEGAPDAKDGGGDDGVDGDTIVRYFNEVLDPDPGAQTEALGRLLGALWRSIPAQVRARASNGTDGGGGSASSDNDPGALVSDHLDTIIRWSCTAPFDCIRSALLEFLERLRAVGVGVDEEARVEAVSTFMSAAEITPIDVAAVDKREVLQRCFLSQGRISHLMRVMVIQPQYLNSFDRAITCLLRAPGPLPLDWRSYIAIMASEVHHCGYMVSRLGIEFLDVGGNEMWLAGLSRAPPKLAKLGELNVTLAHQPWRVAVGHIAALISTGGTDAWSNAELTQAIVLMATFHSLCSFVLGCGLGPELDFSDFRERVSHLRPSGADDELMQAAPTASDDTTQLIEKLCSATRDLSDEDAEDSEVAELTVPPAEIKVEAEPSPEPEISVDTSVDDDGAYLTPSAKASEQFKYSGAFELPYTDFDMHSKELRPLNLTDCSWEELGYSMVGRYLGDDAASLLDEEFKAALEVTDHRVGYNTTEVDTSPYRRGVWYYTQRLWGLVHADYEYKEVNALLDRRMKGYIKLVACCPEKVRVGDFMRAQGGDGGVQFRPTEVCHINILTSEARKQAELLYGLAALNDYTRGL